MNPFRGLDHSSNSAVFLRPKLLNMDNRQKNTSAYEKMLRLMCKRGGAVVADADCVGVVVL